MDYGHGKMEWTMEFCLSCDVELLTESELICKMICDLTKSIKRV